MINMSDPSRPDNQRQAAGPADQGGPSVCQIPLWLSAPGPTAPPAQPILSDDLRCKFLLFNEWNHVPAVEEFETMTRGIFRGPSEADWLVVSFMANAVPGHNMLLWVEVSLDLAGFPEMAVQPLPELLRWDAERMTAGYKLRLGTDELHAFTGLGRFPDEIGRLYVLLARKEHFAWKLLLSVSSRAGVGSELATMRDDDRWRRNGVREPGATLACNLKHGRVPPRRHTQKEASMPALARWSSRSLFVSSTFEDMHAERDQLQQYVLPELEEWLRGRQIHLEAIDLRWGVETTCIAEQDAKELTVLKVCLAEIDRSRPFIIVFLGDRYGWIPPTDRIQSIASEVGLAIDPTPRSVVALEVEYGALRASQTMRPFFYFREPLPYDRIRPEVAARYSDEAGSPEHFRLLGELKARIRERFPDRVRSYSVQWDDTAQRPSGLTAFGNLVLSDLKAELEAEGQDKCAF